MLPDYLLEFNKALKNFQEKFPQTSWTEAFKLTLVNDYTFFSARIEDVKLQYGDTIRFLNNEIIRGINFNSLLAVSEHQTVLKNILDNLENFSLTEDFIKNIHAALMGNSLAWETTFKPELVGQYRNVPTVGSREPYFTNKEYAPHYNLEIIMGSYIETFNWQFEDIDNTKTSKHLITRIAYFHNKFYNEIHPFADGNGRVCRIIIGALLMKHNCPPVFPQIITHSEQVAYISTILACENNKNDELLVSFFAKGMTKYLLNKMSD